MDLTTVVCEDEEEEEEVSEHGTRVEVVQHLGGLKKMQECYLRVHDHHPSPPPRFEKQNSGVEKIVF